MNEIIEMMHRGERSRMMSIDVASRSVEGFIWRNFPDKKTAMMKKYANLIETLPRTQIRSNWEFPSFRLNGHGWLWLGNCDF